ncbi:hypothetical protein GSI_13142 [Ganoderma sinense ZZ0214-1]|uniref:Uncharacterized protein n=1 Tax=Ganoderma sinense ZZ0214-1 TaxID=1077348 RepID=A0A2G8RUS2_9APHY|nr:hypothetical protein GSI_13142 [Ganoderma sinense ZZ0214-1]
MAADNSRRPRYGEEGAVLLDFRQKHRPPKAVIEAIGNDKTTSESFPIWGIELPSEPPAALSEEEKQNYLNQKARKQRTLEAKVNAKANAKANAKVKAKVKAKVNAKVKAKAKAAVSKSGQEKKPERPRPLRPAAPIVPTNAAPNATTGPVPVPPTTQSTTPSKRRAPPSCLPQVMAQAFSAAPGSTAIDHRPRAPAPTVTSFFPLPIPCPLQCGARLKGHAALATSLQPPKCFTPKPCCLTPSVVERLEQYAEGISIAPSHPAPRGIDAISPMMSSSLRSTYTDGDTHTFAQFTTPSLYSDTGSRSPSMDPSPSPSSIWAQTPGWVAAPLLPHTAPRPNAGAMAVQDSVGGTEYVGAACQDFTGAHRGISGSPSSSITPELAPELVGYPHNVEDKCVPQVYPSAKIHSHLGAIACRGVGEQVPQGVHNIAQWEQQPRYTYSAVWSASPTASPHIDRVRSDKASYHPDVPVQYQSTAPLPTYNVDTYVAPKQSSCSELSEALQYGTLMDEHARQENQVTSSWTMDPPEVNVGLYTHWSSSDSGTEPAVSLHPASMYVQGPITHHGWQSGMSTHLWSPGVYAPPLYPYGDRLHTSTTPSSRMVVGSNNSAHIDIQHLGVHHGH